MAFAVIFTNSLTTPVYAKTNNNNLSKIETIAKNTPKFILGNDEKQWSDVSVTKSIPLYDFNGKLIAYSVDLKSETSNKNAFAIISTSPQDDPIIEFGVDSKSPYDKISDDNKTCILDGVGGYYSDEKSEDTYTSLAINKEVSNENINNFTNNIEENKYVSKNPSIAKETRAILENENLKSTTSVAVSLMLTNSLMSANSQTTGYVFTDVPDYQWRGGCAPTSAGMVLKYLYKNKLSNVSPNTLIDKLAYYMDTEEPKGETSTSKVDSGIEDTMNHYGVSADLRTVKRLS